MSNTRHFSVSGTFDSSYMTPSGEEVVELAGIEVQLWHHAPMQSVFLGKGMTDSNGKYTIAFELESPCPFINDGKIADVFIKPFLHGKLLAIAYDPDAKVYFDFLTPAPSDNFKTAINILVKQLKADGNWTKLDRFWIHATEARQHATISLVNPSSTPLEEVNDPLWTASEGYTGDGASSYINTHYNPVSDGVQFTLDSGTLGVYSRTDADSPGFDIGSYNGTYCYHASKWSGDFYTGINTSTNSFLSMADTLGLIIGGRINSSQAVLVQNGSILDTQSSSSTGMVNLTLYIFCRNGSGFAEYFTDRQLALTFVGGGDIDQATFYTAIQNFATTIGFNV